MSTKPGVTYRPLTSTVFSACEGSMLGFNRRDFSVFDADVANSTEVVFSVNDVAISQQQIVLWLLGAYIRQGKSQRDDCAGNHSHKAGDVHAFWTTPDGPVSH